MTEISVINMIYCSLCPSPNGLQNYCISCLSILLYFNNIHIEKFSQEQIEPHIDLIFCAILVLSSPLKLP